MPTNRKTHQEVKDFSRRRFVQKGLSNKDAATLGAQLRIADALEQLVILKSGEVQKSLTKKK